MNCCFPYGHSSNLCHHLLVDFGFPLHILSYSLMFMQLLTQQMSSVLKTWLQHLSEICNYLYMEIFHRIKKQLTLLFLASAFVSSWHMYNAIGINVECDLDLRYSSWCWRNPNLHVLYTTFTASYTQQQQVLVRIKWWDKLSFKETREQQSAECEYIWQHASAELASQLFS